MFRIDPEALAGALISLSELRRAMRSQYKSKSSFDRAILEAADRDQIRLHRHVFPASLTQIERDQLVYDDGRYYIGATVNLEKL